MKCPGANKAPKEITIEIHPENGNNQEVQNNPSGLSAENTENSSNSRSQTSHLKLSESQREELLSMQISTCTVLDYSTRCGKAIRSAIEAAVYNENFDPLIALKAVLASAPPRRRGEMRKRRLDAFFADDGDIN